MRKPRSDRPAVPDGVPPPSGNVDAVLEKRREVVDVLRLFCERPAGRPPLTPAQVKDVTARVEAALGLPPGAARTSLAGLVGCRPGRPELERLGWRLAAGAAAMAVGGEVRPVATVDAWQWCPFQVTRVLRRSDRGKSEFVVRIRYLAGTVAAEAVDLRWSSARVRMLAWEFGFARGSDDRRGRRALDAPEQLVLLRAYGLLPAKAQEFVPVEVKAFRLAAWNRAVLAKRYREGGFQCPAGRPRAFPCHRCPVGYVSCPAATHRETYVTGDCPQCGAAGVAVDPEPPSACAGCRRKAAKFP